MWRPIKLEDIQRGVIIRMTDSSSSQTGGEVYSDATIISAIPGQDVKFARPMIWADSDYDTNQAMVSYETVAISRERMCDGWILVLEDKDGRVRRMMLGARVG